jgi:UDP-3-O-[3-hydroxymyristoyl] glucosamine N-acyltransferase
MTSTQIQVTRTLLEIAEHCGAILEGDGQLAIAGPSDLASAGSDEISFLANPRYASLLASTGAAAVLLANDVACERTDLALLRVADPNNAFTAVVQLFAPAGFVGTPGVHPSSFVDERAELGEGVSVAPLCVIGAGAVIGARVVLRSGVHVGEGVRIGEDTHVHPGVVLADRVQVGARCVLNAGAVVGSEGFGFDPTAEGWAKIPQCGTVIIGDDVEIGANSTIDRARFGATKIGNMVKIDNLVQVAHNCDVQDAALLCSQVGLAGSSTIGKRAVLGGQVGVGGHIRVGEGAQVGGQAGVFGSLEPGGTYAGWPARPVRESLKDVANTKRIPRMQQSLKDISERLERLEPGKQQPGKQ